MEPEPKRRKIYQPPPRRAISSNVNKKECRTISSNVDKKECKTIPSNVDKKERIATSVNTWTVPVAQTSGVNLTIQQAKNIAVTEAQQDGCTGNFRIFDSPFGNFLVPVVPTHAELTG